jgi:hypothetical protein
MSRLTPVTGLLAVASGAAWLVPAIAAWLERGTLGLKEAAVAALGPLLIVSGAIAIWRSFRELRLAAVPAPVRAAIAGNGLFVSFCALEFSDGLIRSGGRIFYWTSILFLPAVALFYGQVLAQRWAWWVARIVTAFFTLWFVGFLFLIPFAHLRGNGGATPWWGRIYAASVTLVFASISAHVFRSLGYAEARTFYGLGPKGRAQR